MAARPSIESRSTDATDGMMSVLWPQGHTTNFYYSFSFLPREEREAISMIYAFCRRIDDIVDEGTSFDATVVDRKRTQLDAWRTAIHSLYGHSVPPPGLELLKKVVARYGIPQQYMLTVIDGCERDLRQQSYSTFAELKEYCYAVASVVGLMSIEIFGYRHEETQQYAINLGYALQLTNIIRDVKADKDRGYIYLPQEDLERFKYRSSDLMNEVYDERFISLMEFQSQRAREYFHKARQELRPDERVNMVAAEIMDAIYYRLLEKIELNEYRVFTRSFRVRTVHKLITALRIWIGTKLFVQRIKPSR
jgi:phytoene synthase